MKKILISIGIVFCFVSIIISAEQIDLTTPYDPDERITSTMKVERLDLNWGDDRISVFLYSTTNGVKFVHHYTGTQATDLMKALNKADLTTNSLQKRVMNRLVTDGLLEGSVSGSPD